MTPIAPSLQQPVDVRRLEQVRAGLEAVRAIVPKQAEVGIDVGNNGEQQRESFFLYLRERLRIFWSATPDEAAVLVNDLLREHRALPQLVRHDDYGWHFHAVPPDAALAARMAVEAAMALADVLRAGEWDRLATCGAEGCEGVLVDLTRNRSRRFCGTTCGNREAAARYRERLREG